MSGTAKPADVRFYIDADVLGLAKVLAALRHDVTYPGDPGAIIHRRERPACPIASTTVKDTDWIPHVTRRGWVIVTRDRSISVKRAEIAAVRDSGARMVVLAGAEAMGTWAQLEVFMTQWRRIENLVARPGPFIYSATRATFRRLSLE